jgi:hypothetical protein
VCDKVKPQTSTMSAAPKRRKAITAGCVPHFNPPAPPAPTATWPQTLPDQIAALVAALNTTPQSETAIAARFTGKGKWKSKLPELLATLAALGRARQLEDGRWLG